jgi:hypothetical protein
MARRRGWGGLVVVMATLLLLSHSTLATDSVLLNKEAAGEHFEVMLYGV